MRTRKDHSRRIIPGGQDVTVKPIVQVHGERCHTIVATTDPDKCLRDAGGYSLLYLHFTERPFLPWHVKMVRNAIELLPGEYEIETRFRQGTITLIRSTLAWSCARGREDDDLGWNRLCDRAKRALLHRNDVVFSGSAEEQYKKASVHLQLLHFPQHYTPLLGSVHRAPADVEMKVHTHTYEHNTLYGSAL